MGDRILYLVRHGQYRMDLQAPNPGTLTALGRRQSHRTGKRLAELPIRIIYHSNLLRAAETAEIIAEYLPNRPLHSTRLLREVVPTSPKPGRRPKSSPAAARWAVDRKRMNAALKKFFTATRGKAEQHELLVMHGNLIRCLIRCLLKDSFNGWVDWGTHQCGITTLVIRTAPAKARLVGYNDVGHLPKSMQTVL